MDYSEATAAIFSVAWSHLRTPGHNTLNKSNSVLIQRFHTYWLKSHGHQYDMKTTERMYSNQVANEDPYSRPHFFTKNNMNKAHFSHFWRNLWWNMVKSSFSSWSRCQAMPGLMIRHLPWLDGWWKDHLLPKWWRSCSRWWRPNCCSFSAIGCIS